MSVGRGYHSRPMDKTVASADEAIADLFDSATLMAGGFGLCDIPEVLSCKVRGANGRRSTVAAGNGSAS